MTKIRSVDRPDADTVADVLALAAAAEQADGVYPLSEDVVLRVRHGGGNHLLAYADDGALAGYAFVEAGSGELVVHPGRRRTGRVMRTVRGWTTSSPLRQSRRRGPTGGWGLRSGSAAVGE